MRDDDYVEKMLKEIAFIEKATASITLDDFLGDEILQHAVFMAILTLGECANRLSDEFLAKHSQIEWHKIIAVRNIAAHGYWELDNQQIYQAVIADLPPLKKYLQTR